MSLFTTRCGSPAQQHRSMHLLLVAAGAAAVLSVQPSARAEDGGALDPVSTVETATSRRLTVFGLTADQQLVSFRVANPAHHRVVGTISGLSGDTALVGIDFRVQDGKLYGVGNAGGIYAIDTESATTTRVSQLTVPLNGASFGVDFNPAANALRIVSDAGQNLSHSVDANTTTTQTALTFPGRTAFAVTGAAYVNNDLDVSTATTLFDIDSVNNVVAIQSPPAGGVLVTAGALGVDVDAPVGFDIYSTLRNGLTVHNTGFAALTAGGQGGLYVVNLLTGHARLVGQFSTRVVDLALPLDQ
ncbi:DUF4394 domain-containing protein [Ramlibacter tataouinensis]|nr:DUF4394 domain-containing protein [Ramlibacter tataouinensis]